MSIGLLIVLTTASIHLFQDAFTHKLHELANAPPADAQLINRAASPPVIGMVDNARQADDGINGGQGNIKALE